MYERRRLERRLRDKEAAYQEVCVYPDMVKIIPVDLHHQYNLILSDFFFFLPILKRLKNWEIRERKKSRDYSKDAERDDDRRREVVNINPCS